MEKNVYFNTGNIQLKNTGQYWAILGNIGLYLAMFGNLYNIGQKCLEKFHRTFWF